MVSLVALVAGVALCITGWGKSYTDPNYLSNWLNCLYAWLMILVLLGAFLKWFDYTNRFCSYMTSISFGLYILHYPVAVSFGYLLKNNATLSPWVIYVVLLVLVFILTPVLYEVVHRIPVIRWMVLGERNSNV